MIEYEPFKPLNKRSKFAKANKDGQIPKDCIYFHWSGKHCWQKDGFYDDVATDCCVLKGEFCKHYIKGVEV